MRLNKRLVELGLSPSRRKADESIVAKEVTINGQVAKLGDTVTEIDRIELRGKSGSSKKPIYVAFHKPVGYVCSHVAQGNNKTIFSLLPKTFAQLKIAGRLDEDSSGLVILSSDGNFIHTLSHPSSAKEKEYVVGLNKALIAVDLKRLRLGIDIDGEIRKFQKISQLNTTTFRVILTEGRNRQIRRMFESLGYRVTHLQRIRIGKYQLNTLGVGKHSVIQPSEVT